MLIDGLKARALIHMLQSGAIAKKQRRIAQDQIAMMKSKPRKQGISFADAAERKSR
jgi:hypothetical protein